MAELNPFDPPDPGANNGAPLTAADLPTRGGKVKREPVLDYPKLAPDPGAPAPLRGIEDRRRQDFGDWEGGRWLDPTPFTERVNVGRYTPPQSWYTKDLSPLEPSVTSSAMSQSLGTNAQIQQANMDDLYRIMQERRQAQMKPELKQKVRVP